MKRRYAEITKTLATPTCHHVDVKAGGTGLMESLEIPPDLFDNNETGTIGSGSFGTCYTMLLQGTTVCAKSF